MKNSNTLSSKRTAFAAALAMHGLVFGALGYLFALQSPPEHLRDRVRQGSRRASVAELVPRLLRQ